MRIQSAITTSDSEPEPDVAVVSGSIRDHVQRHPQPHEVALVVEVANSSLSLDRAKATIYARANIPAYWIINLVEGRGNATRIPPARSLLHTIAAKPRRQPAIKFRWSLPGRRCRPFLSASCCLEESVLSYQSARLINRNGHFIAAARSRTKTPATHQRKASPKPRYSAAMNRPRRRR